MWIKIKITGFPLKKNVWLETSQPHFHSPAVIFRPELHVIIKSPRVSYFLPNVALIWPTPLQCITLKYTFTVLENEEKLHLSVLFEVDEKEITKSKRVWASLSRKEIKKQRTGKHLLALTLLQVYLCSAGVECGWVLLERAALVLARDVWRFSVMWTALPSARVMKLKFISTRP
jgi:hypothetical protein